MAKAISLTSNLAHLSLATRTSNHPFIVLTRVSRQTVKLTPGSSAETYQADMLGPHRINDQTAHISLQISSNVKKQRKKNQPETAPKSAPYQADKLPNLKNRPCRHIPSRPFRPFRRLGKAGSRATNKRPQEQKMKNFENCYSLLKS